jgi:hypothetical protein
MRLFHASIPCLLLAGSATLASGCADLDTCEQGLCGGGGGTASTTSTGAHGGGGTGGEAGNGGGLPTACVPSELGAGEAPADACGVFVSSTRGDDGTGTGTKAAPYATLGKALEAGAGVIYACTDGFDEAVTLPAGSSTAASIARMPGRTWARRRRLRSRLRRMPCRSRWGRARRTSASRTLP